MSNESENSSPNVGAANDSDARKKPKQWTLMFYFASDNPLAPGIVSQLKAIKNAGFHRQVNVVAQFDPYTAGTSTHVFDVNLYNKCSDKDECVFFGGDDPYVRNLVLDKVWPRDEKFDNNGLTIREAIMEGLRTEPGDAERRPAGNEDNTATNLPVYDPPDPPPSQITPDGEPSPKESLLEFLKFCARGYRAEHYMLFIVGHGLVVGNDLFLYDENASEHSLTLKNLAEVLKKFRETLTEEGLGDSPLEMIGFHSCSLSALEVACELNGLANFMLASEGPAFVGSWPYKEILIRLLKDVRDGRMENEEGFKGTIDRIFDYILKNSFDFQLAGYSFDLALCDLRKVATVYTPFKELTEALIAGMEVDKANFKEPLIRRCILLAHWDAQSYWQESYTDLYDFCFCLIRRCGQVEAKDATTGKALQAIMIQCEKLLDVLTKAKDFTGDTERTNPEDGSSKLIMRAEFAGPEYQYSHGLSVYFPWSRPVNDLFWFKEYPSYRFNNPDFNDELPAKEGNPSAWRTFLETYFKETQRAPIGDENGDSRIPRPTVEVLLEKITAKVFPDFGALGGSSLGTGDGKPGPGSGMGSKPGSSSGEGGDCSCPSIKNYPSTTRGEIPTSRDFFKSLRPRAD
jgi:Clostripain family